MIEKFYRSNTVPSYGVKKLCWVLVNFTYQSSKIFKPLIFFSKLIIEDNYTVKPKMQLVMAQLSLILGSNFEP